MEYLRKFVRSDIFALLLLGLFFVAVLWFLGDFSLASGWEYFQFTKFKAINFLNNLLVF